MAEISTLLISTKLADDAFTAKGFPNSDRAKQLGLIAYLLSPTGGGGYGSSVLPAVLIQQTARREAEAAAAAAATVPKTTTVQQLPPAAGTPSDSAPPATPQDIQGIKDRLTKVEATLADYPNLVGTSPP